MKFAQVTSAGVALNSTLDVLFGVKAFDQTNQTGLDRLWTPSQVASGLLSAQGTTGSGAFVLAASPTIGTATINTGTFNNVTINTGVLNSVTLNTATINTGTLNNVTLNTATLNTATINNATLGTATISTATINNATLNNAVLAGPTMTNPVLSTATINTGTLNNVTINTATINRSTVNTATLNNVTINTATINHSILASAVVNDSIVNAATIANSTLNTATINTGTLNNVTINTATIGTSTLNTPTLNTATINTGTLSNVTVGTGTLTNSSLNLLGTISASQLGSAVFTASTMAGSYNKYCLTFENVCPVSTATLTCSLNMQVATSGTSWIAANYVSTLVGFAVTTTFIIGTTSLFYLSGITATTCVGTSTVYGVNGWVEIVNPASTIIRKSIFGGLTYLTPGAVSTLTMANVQPSGLWDGNSSAIVSLAIAFQTGNIATGTIRLYGIK